MSTVSPACGALNRLQPRYIRHQVDFSFYLSERERGESERQVSDAVEFRLVGRVVRAEALGVLSEALAARSTASR